MDMPKLDTSRPAGENYASGQNADKAAENITRSISGSQGGSALEPGTKAGGGDSGPVPRSGWKD